MSDDTTHEDLVPYSHLSFKASHNSYQRDEALTAQLSWYPGDPSRCGCRGLELDVCFFPDNGCDDADASLVVMHDLVPLCGPTLASYLDQLRSWHEENPGHDVVFVTLDLKNIDAPPEVFTELLDTYLRRCFDPACIFQPGRLIKDLSLDLYTNVATYGWPKLPELRGKFIFCLSGDEAQKAHYAQASPAERLCFADQDCSDDDAGLGPPGGGARVVFNFNLYSDDVGRWMPVIGRFRDANMLVRGYVLNSDLLFFNALDAGVNVLATDKVSNHSWACVGSAPFYTRDHVFSNPFPRRALPTPRFHRGA